MKKRLLVSLLAVLLCLSMAMMTACGKSEDKKSEQASSGSAAATTQDVDEPAEAEEPADEPEEEPEEEPAEEPAAQTVEEAIAKDAAAKAEIESIAKQNGMGIQINGNTVTYLVKLDSKVDTASAEAYRTAFDQAFQEQESMMVDSVKQLEDELDITGVVFAVKVTDAADQTIYETSFDSSGMKG